MADLGEGGKVSWNDKESEPRAPPPPLIVLVLALGTFPPQEALHGPQASTGPNPTQARIRLSTCLIR